MTTCYFDADINRWADAIGAQRAREDAEAQTRRARQQNAIAPERDPITAWIRSRLIQTGRRSALDVRADAREESGMVYCGRPRNPKPRRASNKHYAEASNSARLASLYTWQG